MIPEPYEKLADIVYATRPEEELRMDLYVPRRSAGAAPPMVLYIHGGSWRAHSKDTFEMEWLPADGGLAFAAMNYRFSQKAKFPAQIHDAKAAVRWLRAHAGEYGYAADRLGALGTSAGGHLACLLGVTAGNAQLEGDGPHLDQSSAVHAVVSFFAVTDLPAAGELYERRPGKKPDPPGKEPLVSLLGGTVAEKPVLARLASPALQVTSDAPPFMLFHGDADSLCPVDQSIRMHDALRAAGVPCELTIVPGAEHGMERRPWMPSVLAFFREHLS
ncbi:MAG: alpha/beta hydrolase [Phycisphaeraceae bacterium]|nr:alpha/beta hydrolase [Phycisphaeraceae bacterium]